MSRAIVPVAVLVVLGVIGQVAAVNDNVAIGSRQYMDRFQASLHALDAHAAAGAAPSVLDTGVARGVIGPQFGQYEFVSHTMGYATRGIDYNDPARPLVVADSTGVLHPARLTPGATLELGRATTVPATAEVAHGSASCWTAGAQTAVLWVPLSHALASRPWVLDLAITASPVAAAPAEPGASPRLRMYANATTTSGIILTSHEGFRIGHWFLVTHPFAAQRLGFRLAPGQTACIQSGTALSFSR